MYRRQLDKRGAVRKPRRRLPGGFESQPRLAGTSGARQDQQSHIVAEKELA